jgi:hypothetical protein
MINFKMKILKYNPSGSYSVEYIPEDSKCTTIKLDILINPVTITSQNQVLDLLRNSSPQDYWLRELGNADVDMSLLNSLVDTTHSVNEIIASTINNPTTGFSTPSISPRPQGVTVTNPNDPDTQASNSQQTSVRQSGPGSTPEEVATLQDQYRVKLKLLIQEVLMEMAEATV